MTPAESRQLNQECILLDFYDNHDVWHFLSATAMFFSFLVSAATFDLGYNFLVSTCVPIYLQFLLVLDNGVADVKREELHIF